MLKGTHLPITIKEIQAGYLNSSYFKDIYLYLSQNKLPSSKGTMHKIEALSEKYILLDSLLFKLNIEKEKAVLAIPEVCVDQMIALYHSSLCCRMIKKPTSHNGTQWKTESTHVHWTHHNCNNHAIQ